MVEKMQNLRKEEEKSQDPKPYRDATRGVVVRGDNKSPKPPQGKPEPKERQGGIWDVVSHRFDSNRAAIVPVSQRIEDVRRR